MEKFLPAWTYRVPLLLFKTAILPTIFTFGDIFLLSEPLECVFSNLKEIIGHNKYSLFGILENCAIFYVTGDRLDGTQLNISEIEGHLDGCYNPLPLFYKQKGSKLLKMFLAKSESIF